MQKQVNDQSINLKGLSETEGECSSVFVGYTSTLDGEKKRLSGQQRGYAEFDRQAISDIVSTFDRGELTVLDLGCCDGEVTVSRFDDIACVGKVIGVDCTMRDILEAKNKFAKKEKFNFEVVDLDSIDVLDRLDEVINNIGVAKVDIVFSAFTLHHLQHAERLLRSLVQVLAADAKIILRGSDDGAKLLYPNSELLEEILTRYHGLFSSVTDRYNGRKLHQQLFDAGFKHIKLRSVTADTSDKNLMQREGLYRVGFDFRLRRIEQLVERNPKDTHLSKELEWFKKSLAQLHSLFLLPGTWYANTTYIATGEVEE